eukprot:CAMPEP_0182838730 /NCGR_PEP_ID=MMETSP0006_2-20121128/23472_1 /TAXON_ID=97485 /ORGANISM="Prymnesium parvum, Strain Texoma1" /LENGTH=85 /DNA_ID=CAMNT_0024967799 /DNA_START=519 /DNA_END=773 /DNA_ORIENTATION=+
MSAYIQATSPDLGSRALQLPSARPAIEGEKGSVAVEGCIRDSSAWKDAASVTDLLAAMPVSAPPPITFSSNSLRDMRSGTLGSGS